ncbi:carbohydrate kinase [bacterium]
MKTQKTIVGLGEVLWDIYPQEKILGGATANVALNCHRLGEKGVVVSGVGEDPLGDELIRRLRKDNLNTQYIQRLPDRSTGTVGVTLDERGIPHFRCSRDAAFDYLQISGDLENLILHSDAVVFGTLGQRNAISRKTIQHLISIPSNTMKVFDVNFRGWSESIAQIVGETLSHADVLKLNERELNSLRQTFGMKSDNKKIFFESLMERYDLRLIALSLGEMGCIIMDRTEQVVSPGYRVDVLDTTGCGDAFVAGLTVRYLENVSLEETADFANLMGGFLATRNGATPAFSEEDLNRFRETHPDRSDISILSE